jgi:hypothetical protein
LKREILRYLIIQKLKNKVPLTIIYRPNKLFNFINLTFKAETLEVAIDNKLEPPLQENHEQISSSLTKFQPTGANFKSTITPTNSVQKHIQIESTDQTTDDSLSTTSSLSTTTLSNLITDQDFVSSPSLSGQSSTTSLSPINSKNASSTSQSSQSEMVKLVHQLENQQLANIILKNKIASLQAATRTPNSTPTANLIMIGAGQLGSNSLPPTPTNIGAKPDQISADALFQSLIKLSCSNKTINWVR